MEELRSELVEARAKACAAESRAIVANNTANTVQEHLEGLRKQNCTLKTLVAALEAAQSAASSDLCAQGTGGVIVGQQLAQSLRRHQEAAMSQEDGVPQHIAEPSSIADMLAQVAVQQQLMARSLASMQQMQQSRVCIEEEDDFRDTSTTRSFSFSPERSKDVETQRESPSHHNAHSSFGTTMSDRIQTAEQLTPLCMDTKSAQPYTQEELDMYGCSESSLGPDMCIIDSV
jgi:hypothetical protein